jgi:putative flippase GtrA
VLFLGSVKKLREMAAAGMGGIAATAVDVTLLVQLVKHGTAVALAAFIAAASGAAVGFTMNKYIAFRDRSPISVEQCARFGGVAVVTALLMAGAMQLFAVHLGFPVLVAKLVCSATVFLAWAYPAQRYLVFRRRPRLSPWMSLS